MKRYWVIILGAILWGFLMIPSSAVAHASHTGHAASPFDAPKTKKSLHCLLMKHHHATLPFCPHTRLGRSMEIQLKADCGDSSSGTPVQIQWSKTLMLCPSVQKASSTVRRCFLTPKQFRLPSPFRDLPDKPPQHA